MYAFLALWYTVRMEKQSFLSQFYLIGHCGKYGLPWWQCPHLLFVLMGCVIMVSIVFSYALATQFVEDPRLAAMLTLILAGVLMIIAFVITESFQRLAEASQLKSEFVSIVSHQLRAPISNLQWASEVMFSGRIGKVQQEQLPYIQIFRDNTMRMHDLVNELLVVSKISQGKIPVEKKDFSFSELVRKILFEFSPWIKASNLDVKIQEDPKIQAIKGDPSLVRNIIQNFVDNAIRYGKNKISISYALRNKKLYFEIQDDGVGIPKEDQKHIFQKFFRANNAKRHQTDGSGLGLYIAKSMVEKLGGSIGFSSEENKGSKFWFVIPIT